MVKLKTNSHNVSAHFLFKGKYIRGYDDELLPHISRRRDKVRKEVLGASRRALARISPKRVLDVGTGFGISVRLLARRFHDGTRIWSIDASPQVLREARRQLKSKHIKSRVTFKQAKAEALPFSARCFNLVVSFFSIHHLTNPARGLREMARVLSPAGKMIIADWKPVNSPVVPHSAKDIPSSRFVVQALNRLGWSTVLRQGRYWYLVEATK